MFHKEIKPSKTCESYPNRASEKKGDSTFRHSNQANRTVKDFSVLSRTSLAEASAECQLGRQRAPAPPPQSPQAGHTSARPATDPSLSPHPTAASLFTSRLWLFRPLCLQQGIGSLLRN